MAGKHVDSRAENDTDEEPLAGRWLLVTCYDGNTNAVHGWRLWDLEAPDGTRKTDEHFFTRRSEALAECNKRNGG